MRLGRAIEGVICHHGVTHGLWRGSRGSGGQGAGGSPSHTTWRDGGLGMRLAATWLTPLTCQCGHKCGPGFMLTSLTGSVLPHGNVSVSPNCSGQRDLFHRLKSVTLYPPFLPLGSWAWPIVRLQKKNHLKYHLCRLASIFVQSVALWCDVCTKVQQTCVFKRGKGQYFNDSRLPEHIR